MLQDVALAVRLQTLDGKTAVLESEIATLPKQIAEIEKKLEAHKRRLDLDRVALAANGRDRKKLEADIQIHEQKISKLRDQTLQAKTNEQYKAFQSEITWCETEIRKTEDRILELMEASETLERNVKAAETELKRQSEVVDKEKARAKERTAVAQQKLAEMKAERESIVEQMPKSLYADYLRIKKKTHGTVVAEATDGRCEACLISLRPQFYQELKSGQKVMYCESCGRILTYNPPIAFDHNVGPSTASV